MDSNFYLIVALIFISAGMVKGITGMGLPTVAMGLLGSMMPLSMAVSLLFIPALVTNLWQLGAGPALGRILKRLGWMMLCMIFSTIICVQFLLQMNVVWANFALGIALLIYAGYAFIAPKISIARSIETGLSPCMGLITGMVTGMTGVFVMPAVPYLQSLDLSQDELLQALGLSFTLSSLALAFGLYCHDAWDVGALSDSILAVIPALCGMWLGQKIRAKISPKRFRQFFLFFLMCLGLELISAIF